MLTSTLTLPHEVIVSDGGSSDRTRRTGDKKYATVVVFSAPGRQTIARRRNDGARIARGDFLTFLDADCVIPEPDRHFTRALSHFLKNPNLVALSANLHVLPQEETFGHRLVHSVDNLGLRLKNNVYAAALPACSVIDGVTGRSPDFVPSPKGDRLLGWI